MLTNVDFRDTLMNGEEKWRSENNTDSYVFRHHNFAPKTQVGGIFTILALKTLPIARSTAGLSDELLECPLFESHPSMSLLACLR